jgi:O-acetyl-ADP-ribose deacetylase (regulator of RNase III)
VRKQPDAMRALQEQVDARRSRAGGAPGQAVVLEVGVDTFVAKLSGSGGRPATGAFPATVCLVATDFPQGGAIDRRELFAQDRLRKGIASCLKALDAAGVQSLALPLVGAASSGVQTSDPQYEGQRVLMECRMVNAVAGIALGIHDFAPNRRNLREIGIIQWDQEILDMFGAKRGVPLAGTAQSAFQAYMSQIKLALRNGLAGQKTTARDFAGSCNTIFNAQS